MRIHIHQKQLMSIGLIGALSLSICSCAQTETTTELVTEMTSTNIEETTTEATVSESTTEQTTSETEFVTSLPYLRTIDFDGEYIPDGIYFIRPKRIGKDRKSIVVDISGMYYLLEEDIDYLNEGDTLYIGKGTNGYDKDYELIEYTCTRINKDADYCVIETNHLSGIRQYDNTLRFIDSDTNQYCSTYLIAEDYRIAIAENVHIFDGLPFAPFYNISEELHQNYLAGYMLDGYGELTPILFEDEAVNAMSPEEHEMGTSLKYRSIDDMVFAINELSIWGSGGAPSIVVVVKEQTITEMYLNSQRHQPWRYISIDTRYPGYEDRVYRSPLEIEE